MSASHIVCLLFMVVEDFYCDLVDIRIEPVAGYIYNHFLHSFSVRRIYVCVKKLFWLWNIDTLENDYLIYYNIRFYLGFISRK